MQERRLGNTDLELTTIGLGTWALGGPWEFGWGPQDDSEAISAIIKAIELGINWIDTAAAYGLGHSEQLIAKALREVGARPLIATKCGILWDGGGRKINCLKRKSIREECHNSLRRLKVEVIDLYQMHWPVPQEDIEQAWEEMLRLTEEGKVHYIGVSNFNIEQLEFVRKMGPVASLQPPYSMLHREVEDELLIYCAENNIGVLAYSPMQRGLLTGKFSREYLDKLAPDDHRLKNPDFQKPRFDAALELVEQLKRIAELNGWTCAQLALGWILRRDEVTSAIAGARRPEQITETAEASDLNLSDDNIEEIEELLAEFEKKLSKKS